jgi:hypothetical protein
MPRARVVRDATCRAVAALRGRRPHSRPCAHRAHRARAPRSGGGGDLSSLARRP